MAWPTALSLSRVVAGPIIAALILAMPGDAYLIAAVLFALASFTDLIDGKLARYTKTVSPLGIFLDTTADKVLVSMILVALAVSGLSPAWVPIVIISREFLISGLRSFAASQQLIISAHAWGKGKTAVTMAAVFFLLVAASGKSHGVLHPLLNASNWTLAVTLSQWLLYLAVVLTIISGVRYCVDAVPLFRDEHVDEDRRRMAAGG